MEPDHSSCIDSLLKEFPSIQIVATARAFLNELTERNYQKRTVAIIENGSWSPLAARKIKEKLEKSKEIVFCENTVTILSAPNDKTMQEVKALANELVNK